MKVRLGRRYTVVAQRLSPDFSSSHF